MERGLSQAALAELAGVPSSVISAIESGQRDPRVSTLAAILAAMGLTLTTGAASRDRVERRQARSFEDALRLAAALPSRRRGDLTYPKLKSGRGS